jgi:phosphoadenosine phosphosulfate reductase
VLVENTFWGKRDKVDIAIQRLRQFEPPEGYYLAFSGGKDSVTIYRLAEMAGVQFDAHYQITTVDPPELVKFIKRQHPGVERHRPEMSMFRLMLLPRHFMPPMRQARWCCEALKERGGEGRFVLTGIRWAESANRQDRRMVEQCVPLHKRMLHPIIDWIDADVWQFIRQENVPYCRLYDEGFDRLGCILCPNECNPDRIQMQMDRWPQFVKAYINTFDKLVQARKERGRKCTWANGQEMFDWWINRRKHKKQPDIQMELEL